MRIHGSLAALFLLLPAANTRAEWSLGAGIEHFEWAEHTAPITVKESGPLYTFRAGFTHPLGGGFLAHVHGRFYLGGVSYEGTRLFTPSVPATGTTQYSGTTLRGQLRHGLGSAFYATAALDLDVWRRRLSANQIEDYRIASVRFGAEHASSPRAPWSAGAGVKCTLSTHENAHLMGLGFEQNPSLEPGGGVTPYAEFGYAFARHWSLVGSFDGFDFGRSNQVVLTQGRTRTIAYQPASTMRVVGVRLEYRSD